MRQHVEPLTVVTPDVSWESVLKGDGWLADERLGLHYSGKRSQLGSYFLYFAISALNMTAFMSVLLGQLH